MQTRLSEARGPSDLGWLKSRHTFSFGHYHDPKHMGFASMRVLNDDHVAPGAGFATHSHDNMEIISYVLEGALEHKDSMGNGSVIAPGDVQRMSAGTGVTHSEYNHSQEQEVHFLQIWFLPDTQNVAPGYEEKHFPAEEKRGKFRLVASKTGRDGSVSLHQDMDMSVALLDAGESVNYTLKEGRAAWVHVAKGSVTLNSEALRPGDGVGIDEATDLQFTNAEGAEIMIFDMAA